MRRTKANDGRKATKIEVGTVKKRRGDVLLFCVVIVVVVRYIDWT